MTTKIQRAVEAKRGRRYSSRILRERPGVPGGPKGGSWN